MVVTSLVATAKPQAMLALLWLGAGSLGFYVTDKNNLSNYLLVPLSRFFDFHH